MGRTTTSSSFIVIVALGLCLFASAQGRAQVVSVAERHTPRPDGSSIDWSLDRQGGVGKQGILVLGQGSGCASVAENQNIRRARALLPDFAIVTVEKYGVEPHAAPTDPFAGCTATFYAHHTVTQRVLDYQRVLVEAEAQPWWNGQLVLFGGSEGGAAVSILAARVKADAVVVFSVGPGFPLRESFKRVVPPPIAVTADQRFAEIRANPQSSLVWGGSSYRWWADIMDRRLVDDLLQSDAPILLVQGEHDHSTPIEAARAANAAFIAARHTNLTYWEFADYDHQMKDDAGHSHLDAVLGRISAWLRTQLGKPQAG